MAGCGTTGSVHRQIDKGHLGRRHNLVILPEIPAGVALSPRHSVPFTELTSIRSTLIHPRKVPQVRRETDGLRSVPCCQMARLGASTEQAWGVFRESGVMFLAKSNIGMTLRIQSPTAAIHVRDTQTEESQKC
jgi:hypothetical protein